MGAVGHCSILLIPSGDPTGLASFLDIAIASLNATLTNGDRFEIATIYTVG